MLNRGRHLYSAGRPSRWALAHILVSLQLLYFSDHARFTHQVALLLVQHRVGHGLDASMDWIGLDWVGLDWVECWKNLDGLDWIGLRQMDDVILCYRWNKQICLDY